MPLAMPTIARTHAAQARACLGCIFVVFCLTAVSVVAFPTVPASAAAQHARDDSVARLRAALLEPTSPSVSPLLERLPDPPLELGIHTACKKFGRGCPDTYVAFLTQLLDSLQHETAGQESDAVLDKHENASDAEVLRDTERVPADTADGSSAAPLDTWRRCGAWQGDGDGESCPADGQGGALKALPSHELRLPLQLTWGFEARRRLENLLYRLAAREAALVKSIGSPAAVTELLQRHGIPPTARVHLVEDVDDGMAALLAAACALGRNASSPNVRPVEWSQETWEGVYGAWCRHADAPQGVGADRATPSLSLPPVPWRCVGLRGAAWFMRLLVPVDVLLNWLWGATLCVALPSAAVTYILVWLCAGDVWSDTVEAFVLAKTESDDAPRGPAAQTREVRTDAHAPAQSASSCTLRRATTHHENSMTVATSSPSPAPAAHTSGSHHQDALSSLQDELLRQQRLRHAVLRCRFVDSVQHRAPTLFFLKLRQLLCVLVALHLPVSLGRALWASFHVASSVPLLQYLLPTWLMACLSVYVVVPLQVVVLGTALQGALTANSELLAFQAACAAEQRAMVLAASPAASTRGSSR